MQNTLFDFMNDEYYRLMLDMSKQTHTKEELDEIKERFMRMDKTKFSEICREHELEGVVGCFALNIGLEPGKDWRELLEKENRRLSFLKSKSREICSAMRQSGIKMVILKNGGIMQDIMPEAVQCPMEDIDSLVKKEDFYRAHDILIKNGFTFKFRSEYEAEKLDEAYRDGSTEYFITMPDGERMWFELAWRAVAGRWIRPDLEPDTNEFINNAHTAEDTDVYILSPEDNLLQVCIHTAKHSYVRAPGLRLHLDVDRIVSHCVINWDLFLDKVKKAHVKKSTYLSLYIPTVLFGTAIPERVLNELRPENSEKLLCMLSGAGLPHPHEKKFTKPQFLRFQTALYDSGTDMLKVLNPGKKIMHERYNYSNPVLTPYFLICRLFDLAGIRKKK